MNILPFDYARIPPLYFGAGKLALLPEVVRGFGGHVVLVVTGARSLEASGHLAQLRVSLEDAGFEVHRAVCRGEPTADLIDGICAEFRPLGVDLVIGIGGGSAVDAGKAVSAMLPHGNSIFDHLEGVGRGIPHSGGKTPYVAVPTTSGTGSEVTKNAVISRVGPGGYKKSLRHDNLVPDAVILDGELMTGCPAEVTAACGMDAFTQLLEPYLSPTCSPLTEALALSGFEAIRDALLPACGPGAMDPEVRGRMAYAALLSGIALANDGLGIVHGLAGPIGGLFPIPHGVACGTLVAASVRANLKALRARAPGSPGLAKLARVGRLLTGRDIADDTAAADALPDLLEAWTEALAIPRLSAYGIGDADLDAILDQAANRNNPVELTRAAIREMLLERL